MFIIMYTNTAWLIGYYEKALEEYNDALKTYKSDTISLDRANIHRFIGEALCRLGDDLKQAKKEFDLYHSITIKLNDLFEIQRSYITLGNYYMNLTEELTKRIFSKFSRFLKKLNQIYSKMSV